MADNQSYDHHYQQAVDQQPAVSYLTNPNYNPTIVVHHHHGATLNLVLMAVTGTLVILLCLFLASVAFYIYRKRCQSRLKKAEKASEFGSTGNPADFSRSVLDSERDVDSTFRHSRATCDTCSTRVRTTRPPLSYSPTPQRQSFLSRQSQYLASESPQATVEEHNNHFGLSVRLQQQQSQTTLAESALAEYKGKFDWDRCDFEMQEEEAMWLPNRPQALKSHQSLKRGFSHSRSCSESATSPPSKSLVLPCLARTRSRVTWTDSPLSIEAQSDYFEGQRTAGSSFAEISPGPSTPKTAGDHSPLIPASPSLVQSAPRHSYSARVGTRDWEYHTDAIEHLNQASSYRSLKSPSASISSSFSDMTAFSDPFGGSRPDLSSDFVVLSRPSPTRIERALPKLQDLKTAVETRSLRSANSPLISSPLKSTSELPLNEGSFREPLANQVAHGRKSEAFDRHTSNPGQRRRSATVGLAEIYLPLETPLRTHRIDRRGAMVAANIPVHTTVTDYASLR